MVIKPLTIAEIEYISHRLAKELLVFDEPILKFGTRFPNILESCLLTPFQSFSTKSFYHGLVAKAAILFYLMIKNHPFTNGNKRIAMTTLFYFLYKHNKWLRVDNTELYNFARWIAESNPKLKADTVAAIETFIKSYLVSLKKSI